MNYGEITLKKTVYTRPHICKVPVLMAREMFADLITSRGLAWRLFVRNIKAQYRQSALGYLWAFLPPLFTMVVWVYLNSQKIINIDDPGMPYPVFVMTGTVLWQVFVDALHSPLRVMNESRSMLTKINFPREALNLAGLGEILFNFMIRILLVGCRFVWFKVSVPDTATLVFPGVLVLILLGMMFGVLLTPLGMLYHDVGRALGLLAQSGFS